MSESTNSTTKMTTSATALAVAERPKIPATNVERAQAITNTIVSHLDCLGRRLGKAMWRLVMMGMFLHVAEHFAPELRQYMPVVYQIIDGGMTLVNFIFEWGLKLITAILTGKFLEINPDFQKAFRDILTTFWTWMTSL